MKILALDIEASGLTADFGIVLCSGFKFVGEGRTEVLSIADYDYKDIIRREKELLKDMSKRMLDADVWLFHYGTYYDVPFINTRLLYHGLPTLPSGYASTDTWKIARNRLRLRNNRLKTISEFLGTDEEKNAIKPEQWIRALGGHKKSLDYIIEHCRRDIDVLEEVYLRIGPMSSELPSRGLIDGRGGCSFCGGSGLQKRGFHITRTRKYQRYQCRDCGAWSKGTKPVEVAKHAPGSEPGRPDRNKNGS